MNITITRSWSQNLSNTAYLWLLIASLLVLAACFPRLNGTISFCFLMPRFYNSVLSLISPANFNSFSLLVRNLRNSGWTFSFETWLVKSCSLLSSSMSIAAWKRFYLPLFFELITDESSCILSVSHGDTNYFVWLLRSESRSNPPPNGLVSLIVRTCNVLVSIRRAIPPRRIAVLAVCILCSKI